MGPVGEESRSTFTSTTGGVMTEEAGAITGELELSCRPEADRLYVLVRYAGADEWYIVSGSPIPTQDDLDKASEKVVQHLRTPGPVEDGNETAATLEGFARA
jgi:predicted glycosyltransferase